MAARSVDALLRSCGQLRVVATSREGLAIGGRGRLPGPIAIPARTREPRRRATCRSYEAIQLFVERAIAAAPGFQITDRNAVGDRPDLPPPRRRPAGARARRGPGPRAASRADRGPARRSVPPADRLAAGSPSRVTRRSGRPSTGATTCWPTTSEPSSGALPSSPVAVRSMPPRRSARRTGRARFRAGHPLAPGRQVAARRRYRGRGGPLPPARDDPRSTRATA